MRFQFLPAILLAFSINSLHANQDQYRFEGLNKPVSINWDGNRSVLEKSLSFCVRLDSSAKYAVPSKLDETSIRYKLRFIDQNSGTSGFFANSARSTDKIPLELSLTGEGSLTPGKNTQEITDNAFCANKQNLIIKAKNLSQYQAGDYTARIQVIAESKTFRVVSDQDMTVNLSIPKLISINGDQQISLGDFSNTDLKKSANFCVFRNGQGDYRLKAEGIGTPNNQFELQKQGGTAKLPYQVKINANNGGYQQVSPKMPISNLRGNASIGCVKGGKNLDVQVTIPQRAAESVYAGSYQGRLKIIVEVQ